MPTEQANEVTGKLEAVAVLRACLNHDTDTATMLVPESDDSQILRDMTGVAIMLARALASSEGTTVDMVCDAAVRLAVKGAA